MSGRFPFPSRQWLEAEAARRGITPGAVLDEVLAVSDEGEPLLSDAVVMNCPFYGRALFTTLIVPSRPPFVLFATAGNQCGLTTTSHAPCRMEIAGETPDWKTCILVKEIRCEETV